MHPRKDVLMSPSTILIVDDSKTTLATTRVHLMGGEYDFVEAPNGEQALKLANRMRPDLVISDVHMPGISGIQLCEALKRLRPLPVVLITSKLTEQVQTDAIRAGADAILRKPVNPDQLQSIVKTLLAQAAT